VQGTQTAIVVGPRGEEIFTDKYGRVKVQFHWDREGKNNEESSCWVRVGTPWAGKQWGAIYIPRIEQEVIVDFLEGDPDQPIVIGSVYNAREMPPYKLPDNKTQSGIKSRSSLAGSADNFNEFRFDDKKGEEQVYLHAEKDWKIEVEHDRNQHVGNDETTTIDHNESRTVGNDQTLTVQNNRTTTVMMDHSETVGKNQTITISTNQSITVGASQSTMVGTSITITAGAAITISAGGPITITAPMITLNAATVLVSGVVQCATLVTGSVVSPLYTPGVGNLV
jgi:type VI secretion system secreted protein VgrG